MGLETAHQLVAKGQNVMIVGSSDTKLAEAKAALGKSAETYQLDLKDSDAVSEFISNLNAENRHKINL